MSGKSAGFGKSRPRLFVAAAFAALLFPANLTDDAVAQERGGRGPSSVTTGRGGGEGSSVRGSTSVQRSGGGGAGRGYSAPRRSTPAIPQSPSSGSGHIPSGRSSGASERYEPRGYGRGYDVTPYYDRIERYERDDDWRRDHDRDNHDHDRHKYHSYYYYPYYYYYPHRGHPRGYYPYHYSYPYYYGHYRPSLYYGYGGGSLRFGYHERYLFPSYHVHGPHCGHYYYGGYWHVYPRSYYSIHEYYLPYGYGYYEDSYYGSAYDGEHYQGADDRPPLPSELAPAELQTGRGYRLFELQDYYGAVAAFNAALLEEPGDSGLYLMRGLAYVGIAEAHGAARDFAEWIERTPPEARRGLQASAWYGDANELNRHVAEVHSRAREYRQSAEHQFVDAVMLFLADRDAESRAALDRTLALRPDHQAARALLEQLREERI